MLRRARQVGVTGILMKQASGAPSGSNARCHRARLVDDLLDAGIVEGDVRIVMQQGAEQASHLAGLNVPRAIQVVDPERDCAPGSAF